jgi:FtsP/CotA-like multicopper oxidase with cupredoxin domain
MKTITKWMAITLSLFAAVLLAACSSTNDDLIHQRRGAVDVQGNVTGQTAPATPAGARVALQVAPLAALAGDTAVLMVDETGQVAASQVVTPTNGRFSLSVPEGHDYVMIFRQGSDTGRNLGILTPDATGLTTISLPAGAAGLDLGDIELDPKTGKARCLVPKEVVHAEAEFPDSDSDGLPDVCDDSDDEDGDLVADNQDAFPFDDAEFEDTDDDGIGDNADDDDDEDGVADDEDAFPKDPAEVADTDGDGVGDNSDAFINDPAASTDTDGDGHPDGWNANATPAQIAASPLLLDVFPLDPARSVATLLDGAAIPKFVTPLDIPAVMPETVPAPAGVPDYYEIAVRQFKQRILPDTDIAGQPLGETTVWGYGSINHPESFHYPAPTIEAAANTPLRVKWINDLKDAGGNFLPHLLPIDQTLHWANPAMGPDMAGTDPAPYTGPVPMVAHLHGAHVSQESDGYPEAWFLPAAANLAGFIPQGSKYAQFKGEAEAAYGQSWEPGTAVFQYPNDQRAATLWFHDHSLGMTRANVYAGPTGFYLIRGGAGDLESGLPAGPYEIPLVVQDRSFKDDGSLFYPADRAFFEGLEKEQLQIPFVPDDTVDGEASDIAPIWNPEFFGNTVVVNGRTWPFLTVEQRRYRFRILNGSDSRFFILKLSNGQPFWQIGNDGGFLAAPAELETLLIAPAERADVIIDFSAVPAGTEIVLENLGPDEPFGGGEPGVDFEPADGATTGRVMQFRIAALSGTDDTVAPVALELPAVTPILGEGEEPVVRHLSLNELMSETVFIPVDAAGDPVLDEAGNLVAVPMATEGADMFGPARAQLGIMVDGAPVALSWMDMITEQPVVNQAEEWVLYNYTADAHPIHLHQIEFEVVRRIDQEGNVTGPEPWETGFKDTVIAYPGDEGDNPGITVVRVRFDIPGLFVWHCHILSHEDNEMMRPYCVGGQDTCPVPISAP